MPTNANEGWPTAKRLYAYCDETAFESPMGQTYGTGILLTEEPISSAIIDRAMAALRVDPEKDDVRDDRTIARGYFHASEDSKNAHSPLCRAITSELEGLFIYEHTRSEPSRLVRYRREPGANDHFSTTFGYALLNAMQHARDLEIVVERRGTITEGTVLRIIESLFQAVERSIYELPDIPSSFPRCSVRILGKDEPGIQVTDFLLWANNRAVSTKADCVWRDRLRSTFSMSHSIQGTPETGGDMAFKRHITSPLTFYPSAALPTGDPEGDEFWRSVALAENVLRQVAAQELPPHVGHLVQRLKNTIRALDAGSTVTQATMDEAARLYIRLFDTLPITLGLAETEVEKWKKLLLAKKMAALRLRKDLVHGVRSAIEARRWRKQVLDEDPRSPWFFVDSRK
jgi:hypothetical protein